MNIKKESKNNKVFCHDCKKEIDIKDKEIKNGLLLVYKNGNEKIEVFKCNACFEKETSLSNYQKCEVYSRVVGYLRPVQQWNETKRAEFQGRIEYEVNKKCCSCLKRA